ncbi:MAG: Xaa-Pro aminopeptidase, partial [Verrucomicrobiota bacterium]
MRYQPLPADLFVANRQRLYTKLPPNSLVIVHANDVLPTNADGSL